MKTIVSLILCTLFASLPAFASSDAPLTDKNCVQLSKVAAHAVFQFQKKVPESETLKFADKFSNKRMKQEVMDVIELAYMQEPLSNAQDIIEMAEGYKKEVYLMCHDFWVTQYLIPFPTKNILK